MSQTGVPFGEVTTVKEWLGLNIPVGHPENEHPAYPVIGPDCPLLFIGRDTTAGKQEVKKALRSVVWIKYQIKDKEVFDKAYSYIEQYY